MCSSGWCGGKGVKADGGDTKVAYRVGGVQLEGVARWGAIVFDEFDGSAK